MTEQELAESIYWEAEQYIPFDIQDVNLDYEILDRARRRTAGTMDVLLVAAKKDKIADYTSVITQAGRARHRGRRRLRAAERLRGQLRLRAGRGGRAAQRRRQRHQHQHPQGRQSVFTRDISMGGNAFTEPSRRTEPALTNRPSS